MASLHDATTRSGFGTHRRGLRKCQMVLKMGFAGRDGAFWNENKVSQCAKACFEMKMGFAVCDGRF